jgi:hypothetical protein
MNVVTDAQCEEAFTKCGFMNCIETTKFQNLKGSGAVLQGRFGSGAGCVVLSIIPLIVIFNTTVVSMASNARWENLYHLSET